MSTHFSHVLGPNEVGAFTNLAIILVSISVVILFKNDLRNVSGKRYLIAFYLSALVYFIAIKSPSTDYLGLYYQFVDLVGAMMAFFIPAFLCQREKKIKAFRFLVGLLFLNLLLIFLTTYPLVVAYLFAITCNLISLYVIFVVPKNKANIGMAVCILLMTCLLVFQVYSMQFTTDRALVFEKYFVWLLVVLPAYLCGITFFIFLHYMLGANARLKEMAYKDTLTNLFNRKYAFKAIEKYLNLQARTKSVSSVIMADIDFFKKVNDGHGHVAGDKVIQVFSVIIRRELRDYDIAARYGGEEFLIFMPNTAKQSAYIVAERIRKSIEQYPIETENGTIRVTASLGVNEWQLSESFEKNIDHADQALYRAKQGGRNQTVLNLEYES